MRLDWQVLRIEQAGYDPADGRQVVGGTWIMVPAAAVDRVIDDLLPLLSAGDTLSDGDNSNYRDAITRSARLAPAGIHCLDCSTNGGGP